MELNAALLLELTLLLKPNFIQTCTNGHAFLCREFWALWVLACQFPKVDLLAELQGYDGAAAKLLLQALEL